MHRGVRKPIVDYGGTVSVATKYFLINGSVTRLVGSDPLTTANGQACLLVSVLAACGFVDYWKSSATTTGALPQPAVTRDVDVTYVGFSLGFGVSGAEQPVIVRGNRDAIHQALRNLVENALRFTPPGTEVEISVDQDGTVKANGVAADMVGISKHVIHSNTTLVENRDSLIKRRDRTWPDTFIYGWLQTEPHFRGNTG